MSYERVRELLPVGVHRVERNQGTAAPCDICGDLNKTPLASFRPETDLTECRLCRECLALGQAAIGPASALVWRKETPGGGWWWLRLPNGSHEVVHVTFGDLVIGPTPDKFIRRMGRKLEQLTDEMFSDCLWAGPIELPGREG